MDTRSSTRLKFFTGLNPKRYRSYLYCRAVQFVESLQLSHQLMHLHKISH